MNTGTDGTDVKLAESSAESVIGAEPGQEKPASDDKIDAPAFGFDETGRQFVLKIDVRHGYLAVLGFFEEAKDFFKHQIREQQRLAKEKSIIKPPQGKWGKFFNK